MKDTLKPGLAHQFKFKIPPTKTVPQLYPESEAFQQMPQVLATGFMVGLLEWACIEAIRPHLDWPREQSLGTLVNFSHLAATPPGLTVTVDVKLDRVEGRKLVFTLAAHDGVDRIAEGTHERFVIDAGKFNAKVADKARAAAPARLRGSAMAQTVYVPKAQETRNKAVVERYFREVLDQKRFDVMPDLIAQDAILHRPGFDVNGLPAAMQRLRAVLQDYTAFSTELSGLMAEGDMVSVRVRHRTRVRPHAFHSRAGDVAVAAEQALDWNAIAQFRIKDGKIAEEWVMRDELGMLVQMGKVSIGP